MRRRLAAALVVLWLHALPIAFAQTVDGLPIKLGDNVETVRAALKTEQMPVDVKSATHNGASALKVLDQGIWVFFDRQGRSYTIRLEAPFAGNIRGARIGSSQEQLVEALGEPTTPTAVPGLPEIKIFRLGDQSSARFDFNREGQVERIFISAASR